MASLRLLFFSMCAISVVASRYDIPKGLELSAEVTKPGLCGPKGCALYQNRDLPEGSVNDQALIARVNSLNTSWLAAESERFSNYSFTDVSKLCGTVMKGEKGYFELEAQSAPLQTVDLPENFDAREKWPQCPTIGTIRDQSDCGSCWAFGSTEAFEDRACIANKQSVLRSVEDTTSCCGIFNCAFSMGCNGGQPSGAWNWFKNTGVVTGGDYKDIGAGTTCMPYTLAPCAHHVAPGKYPACPSSEYPTPKCTSTCPESGYSTPFSEDKLKAKSAYSLSGVQNIMQDIYTYGPVTGAFSVYSDFPTYKSGVYTKTPGSQMLGGHAIKIMGWGVENGVDYWLVANSWNEQWGDGGTFKIKRGVDECGIESQISAGHL